MLPPTSLECFDFNAVLDSSDPDTTQVPAAPGVASLVNRLADASPRDLCTVTDTITTLRQLASGSTFDAGRALLLAIEERRDEVVALLLSEGVKITFNEVHTATVSKNIAALELLFQSGWDINREFGWADPPALAYAVDDIALTTWFLDHGADPNASSALDKTPLTAAVQYAPLPIIELLFSRGGSIRRGHVLHAAIWRKLEDRLTIIDYLLAKGSQINAVIYCDRPEIYEMRRPFGLGSPLHEAATLGDPRVVKFLLSRGARTDIIDSLGLLAIQRAESRGHHAAVECLRDAMSTRSERGTTSDMSPKI